MSDAHYANGFFFRTFQVVVQALYNACAMAVIDVPSFLSLLFSQRQLSGLHVALSFLTQMQSSQAKPKAKTKIKHSELFIV